MRVSKWGDSLAVRLPKKLVNDLKLVAGDELVVIESSKHQIVVEKADPRARFIESMERFRWEAAEGWKFDRDEANER